MPFEKFVQKASRHNVRASINPRGSIGLTGGAQHRYQIDEETHFVLYYDRDTRRIGLIKAESGAEGAKKVYVHRSGAILRAKPFFDYYDIAVPVTILLPIDEVNLKNGQTMLILDMTKGEPRKANPKGASTSSPASPFEDEEYDPFVDE